MVNSNTAPLLLVQNKWYERKELLTYTSVLHVACSQFTGSLSVHIASINIGYFSFHVELTS
jgi:hypothetical protein